nr:MAG TPA: hypothetical protein [Caudoviricetes sp.]
MRPIDADALKLAIPETTVDASTKYRYCVTFEREDVLAIIDAAPTVEIDRPTRSQFKRMAVQLGYEKVVHCKDCKRYSESEPHYRIYGDGNCRTWNSYVSEKGFCYYGERKTDEKV